MKKLLLVFIFGMLLISLTSATNIIQQNTPTVKQGQPFLLEQFCSNSTYANISSIKTSSINLLGETNMIELSNDYYQYSFTNTTILGFYSAIYHCDENGVDIGGKTDFEVTNSGKTFSLGEILVYVLFLILCIGGLYYSSILLKSNAINKDPMFDLKMYEMKKRNEFSYFLTVMKSKLYIVGSFGIYLFLLLFVVLLNQLVYNLGFMDLNEILINIVLILSWGLIPFTLFWGIYLIIVFYKTTERIMRYQFGNMGGGRK